MHSWYNIGIKPQQPTKASCRDRQHYPDNTVYSRSRFNECKQFNFWEEHIVYLDVFLLFVETAEIIEL